MSGSAPPTQPAALVVDDDPDINRLVAFRLQRRGFRVSTAASGEEALARIRLDAPDYLFLDVSMPGISGLDVLDVVHRERLDIAVVMMTAFGSEQIAADAMRRGADDYLRKPFESADFQGVVERVVARLDLRRRNVALERELDIRRRQLEAELANAATVQADLLPLTAPTIPGYSVAARCIPAREVGGDFYYWCRRSDGQLDVAFGDVMGKGMPAALLMATVRAALRALLPGLSVGAAVERLSVVMDDDLRRSGSFVTLFVLRLDPASGIVRYVDAGHGLAAVVTPDGRAFRPECRGLPVGISLDAGGVEGEFCILPGGRFVLFSDGLTDFHPDLLDCARAGLSRLLPLDANGVVCSLVSGDREHQEDDITVLAIAREGAE